MYVGLKAALVAVRLGGGGPLAARKRIEPPPPQRVGNGLVGGARGAIGGYVGLVALGLDNAAVHEIQATLEAAAPHPVINQKVVGALQRAKVPVGDYSSVSVVVGVDSARTKAGNFTEVALNANSGMLWTMNGVDEFINLNLGGYSSRARSGGLTFHIAGYQHASTITIRTVTVTVPASNSPLLVRADRSPKIHMRVDIAKMFSGPHLIKFADTYSVMGGAPAVKVADNIAAGMF